MKKQLHLLYLLLFLSTKLAAQEPNPPASFTITARTVNSIQVSWTAPATTPPNPNGYVIYAKTTVSSFPIVSNADAVPSDELDLSDGIGVKSTDASTFTFTFSTGLDPATQYDFRIYAYRTGGGSDDPYYSTPVDVSAYTHQTEPGSYPGDFTFSATPSATQVSLSFTKASRLPLNAHGYLVLRRAGSAPTTTGIIDGSPPGGTYHIGTVTDSTETAFLDNTGVSGGITYHYALVPYRVGFSGSPISATYNYGTISSVSTAAIPSVASISQQSGGVTSALVGGNTNRAIIGFSFTTNGSQNITEAVFTLNNDPSTLELSGFELWESNVATYNGTDGTVVATGGNIDVTGGVVTASGFSAIPSKYYFLICDVAATAPSNSFNVEFTSATASPGTISTSAPYFSRTGITISPLTATIAQQTGGVSSTIAGGDTNKAIIGFSFTSNGSQNITQAVFTLSANASTLNLSGFELWESNVATFDGVDGAVVATGGNVNVTGAVVSISGFSALSSKYYFLICDVALSATSATFNTTFTSAVISPGTITTSAPYFTRTGTSIVPLNASLAQLTTGIAVSPLTAGTVGNTSQNAILGFSLSSTGSQTVSALKFAFNTDPSIKFSAYSLVLSTDNSFATTVDNSTIALDAPVFSGTGPYYVELTPSTPINITTVKNLFLVATVDGDVNGTTLPASITPSLSTADITVSPTNIIANSFSGTAYGFQASQASTIAIHSTPGTTTPINFGTYSTQTASSGLTWGGTPNSTSLANFRIRDGGPSNNDTDTQDTKVTSFTITITNPQDLEAVAIFYGNSISNSNIKVGEQPIGSGTLTFSLAGTTLTQALVADDNTDAYFTVRATFKSSFSTTPDNNTHVVTVTAATVDPDGSQLSASPLALATTGIGATINNINVVATKVIFMETMPIFTNPNTDFAATIQATDANNNLDLNHTSNVTIQVSGGPGTVSASEGVTHALVAGTYQWTTLQVTLAGSYTITGNHASFTGGNDATGTLTVASLGVSITDGIGPDPGTTNLCFGGDFQTISNIRITESDPSDFSVGTNVSYSIILPDGFVFDPSVTTAPTLSGPEISAASALTYLAGNTVVRFTYTVTGITNLNSITLTGLSVKYTLGTPPATSEILRIGGTASQEKNSDTDAIVHGIVTVSFASNDGYDFIVKAFPGQSAIQQNETNFSSSINGIILEPSPANSPALTNEYFTGNGVSFSNTQNRYVFSPSSVGVGSNYTVTYVGTSPSGCQVSVVKNFSVFALAITGLQSEYCANDITPYSFSVDPARYNVSLYYPAWNSGQSYGTYNYISYNSKAYYSLLPSTNVVPEGNPSYWREWGYNFTGYYSIYIPSYRYFESVENNGAGTLTITVSDHGFVNGALVWMYGYIYDSNWNFLFYLPYAQYTLSNVTQNTFDVSFSHPSVGTFTNMYGYTIIQGPQVQGVSGVGTSNLTITAPNHGLSNGVTIRVYLEGIRDNGVSNVIDNWYTVSGVTTNTFNITTPNPVTGSWTGYGFVDIFYYRISTFTPASVANLNSNIKSPSLVYLGYMVNSIDCTIGTWNTCPMFTYQEEPVRLNQLPNLDFGPLQVSYCEGTTAVTLTGNQPDGTFTGLGILDGGPNNPTAQFNPSGGGIIFGDPIDVTYTSTDNNSCTISTTKSTVVTALPVVYAGDPAGIDVCQGTPATLGALNGDPTATGNGPFTFQWAPAAGLNADYISNPLADPTVNTTYTLTVTDAFNCQRQGSVVVNTFVPPTVNAGPDVQICSDADVDLNTLGASFNPPATSAQWTVAGGATGIFKNSAQNPISAPFMLGTARYYEPSPSEVNAGVFILELTTDDPTGPCTIAVDDSRVTIYPGSAPPIINPLPPICVGDVSPSLFASVPINTLVRWYSDPGLTTLIGNTNPAPSNVSTQRDTLVVFYGTQTPISTGCQSLPSQITLVVNPNPVATFSAANFCLGEITQFVSNSSVTYNPSTGESGSVNQWAWEFADGSTGSTLENPQHRYTNIGNYNVKLTVQTDDGCSDVVFYGDFNPGPLRIGHVPFAEYNYFNVCDGDATQFDYLENLNPAKDDMRSFEWTFSDPSSGTDNLSNLSDPSHVFSSFGAYQVKLKLISNLDCLDSITKPVFILPYITDFANPYIESFESTNHGWAHEGLAVDFRTNTIPDSWNLISPSASSNISSAFHGSNAWVTNIAGVHGNNERSVLYGPCIDVTQLQKPALAFAYWSNLEPGGDGVYLETSTNNGNTWVPLGNNSTGLRWYNGSSISGLTNQTNVINGSNGGTVGQPLNQYGFTSSSNTWVTGKYSLDAFAGQTKLRVRFVFGSNGDNPPGSSFEGFAMDYFRLDSRNKVILAENFTNSSENANNNAFANYKQAATDIELLKIQYHTTLKGPDPLNSENSADPNARVAFYGITNTNSLIPRAYIDGYSAGDFTLPWVDTYYSLRTLEDAPFRISLATNATSPGSLDISATIEAILDLPASERPVVRIAIVEKTVGTNQYVLRKFLPSAAGYPLTNPNTAITVGQVFQVPNMIWTVDHANIDQSNLAVILFIQDQENNAEGFKQIYQSAIEVNPTITPSVVTGIENPEFSDKIQLYPNPANQELNVVLPETATEAIPLTLVDTHGRTVFDGAFKAGERHKIISTSEFAAGMYILRINAPQGAAWKKVMIVHNH